ncbi:flagellar hook-basal body complex protein [Anaerovibrio lipolyticus]|uniref:flagellar hook-basal body complex protein n=1 Tax=Anaerovibrio lipolyticus TaxID=82374 RepID=UPI000480D07F|nr:flagellar hook-basal body complex protein [Anaerovibrio lipolyticus]
MMRSLFSGVSGLKNHQTRMDVIGNNISNVNTTGFKSSRVNFEDSLSQTLTAASQASGTTGGTNPKQIGLGSKISAIDVNFKDGSVQTTGINTDLCLSGNALFVVKQGNQTYYTRNGAFNFDADGNLVNAEGLYVQGYANASATDHNSINTNGATSAIQIRAGKTMPSSETSIVNYLNNLNASSAGIESISYTDKDGKTYSTKVKGAVVDLTPTRTDEVTITIGLADGRKVDKTVPPSMANSYTTGKPFKETIKYVFKNATSNSAGDLALKLASNSGQTIVFRNNPIDATVGKTYSLGQKYEISSIISEVTANTDGTVTIKFDSGDVESVTIPKPPEEGLFVPGEPFEIDAKVSEIEMHAGATCELQDYSDKNGSYTIPAATVVTVVEGGTEEVSVEYDSTITDIARAVTRGESEQSIVSAVLTMSDGTTQTVTSGKYTVGNSIPLSTTVKVYDSLGADHVVPITLEKSYLADNQWIAKLAKDTIVEEDGTETTLSMPDTVVPFTESGAYASTGSPGILKLQYGNGAADQQVTINYSNLTQYANSSTANAEANGYASGTLETVTIDESGTVVGTYTNGVLRKEAQIAVAQFTNAPGLTKKGNSLYVESNNSGTPNIGTAQSFGATITASALEMSNVDVAEEFSNMIITQRGFQSNSKIITVSDEMLENLINMKR